MSETSKELMNRLYTENGLAPEDVFKHKHYRIITRQGIEKIQAKKLISINYKIEYIKRVEGVQDPNGRMVNSLDVIVKAIATNPENIRIETYGESSPENTKQVYPVAIAEKRAKSRAVLQLAGLYKLGFFGEEEADDFAKTVSSKRQAATYKEE